MRLKTESIKEENVISGREKRKIGFSNHKKDHNKESQDRNVPKKAKRRKTQKNLKPKP